MSEYTKFEFFNGDETIMRQMFSKVIPILTCIQQVGGNTGLMVIHTQNKPNKNIWEEIENRFNNAPL